MANPHASPPLVTALVMPNSGLAAVMCPGCRNYHLHHAAGGLSRAPCGFGTYRVRITGAADESMARRIRSALEAKHRNERREAPSSTES